MGKASEREKKECKGAKKKRMSGKSLDGGPSIGQAWMIGYQLGKAR